MKEKFIKSSLILIIGGLFTKVLGIIIRMTLSRVTTMETISIYMLILPTFSLMMAISQLGFSTSISKLVSENRYKSKKLLFRDVLFNFTILPALLPAVFFLPLQKNRQSLPQSA